MKNAKGTHISPHHMFIIVMLSGQPVTVEEFREKLKDHVAVHRLSAYMWQIKTIAGGIIKTIKNKRNVLAYQLLNVDEMKRYLKRVGIAPTDFVPVKIVENLNELKETLNESETHENLTVA